MCDCKVCTTLSDSKITISLWRHIILSVSLSMRVVCFHIHRLLPICNHHVIQDVHSSLYFIKKQNSCEGFEMWKLWKVSVDCSNRKISWKLMINLSLIQSVFDSADSDICLCIWKPWFTVIRCLVTACRMFSSCVLN